MYNLEVDYSPVYEFVTSLYYYVNKDRLKIYDLGSDWKKEVDQKLQPIFKEALKDKRMEILHRFSLLIHKCPGERTPENFIKWFAQLSTVEMYDCMRPWVDVIPMDIVDLHQHLVYLFTEWNEQYFKHIDPSILEALENDANEKRKLIQDLDPVDIVEHSTNGIRIESERIQKLLLVPQYHYAPLSVVDYYKGFVTCLYPIELQRNSPYISRRTITMFNSLSDENRILILKSLHAKPRTFKELTEITQLAKSNLHYHLSLLRCAGLIRAHHSSERVINYSLRIQQIATIQDRLLSYIKEND
ncbi:ArsR/SmtB family transcription factor [Brevibacillus laterosporus]|uniref:ArsR/SmtB family transcription factor n=1 Tax=Brevibacillus laterosporus TaxID=1465 RepID=UPI002656A464|nr:winged helix-turn-helix domain-containing protein [Brevibacillus laterosporus]MDN9011420.1 winged helix-turn-helix domain-containing protein [Brevibacillus laterosporus]MDO0942402.1 winged helix-turn-helix domain-containing protein [Brevibacillus laterosporus]